MLGFMSILGSPNHWSPKLSWLSPNHWSPKKEPFWCFVSCLGSVFASPSHDRPKGSLDEGMKWVSFSIEPAESGHPMEPIRE